MMRRFVVESEEGGRVAWVGTTVRRARCRDLSTKKVWRGKWRVQVGPLVWHLANHRRSAVLGAQSHRQLPRVCISAMLKGSGMIAFLCSAPCSYDALSTPLEPSKLTTLSTTHRDHRIPISPSQSVPGALQTSCARCLQRGLPDPPPGPCRLSAHPANQPWHGHGQHQRHYPSPSNPSIAWTRPGKAKQGKARQAKARSAKARGDICCLRGGLVIQSVAKASCIASHRLPQNRTASGTALRAFANRGIRRVHPSIASQLFALSSRLSQRHASR